MPKILLIALYDFYSQGIRGLHSFLVEKEYDVHSIFFRSTTYTEGLYRPEELSAAIAKIKEIAPDYIGIAVRSPIFPVFVDFCNYIRMVLPKAKIIAGGAHATADPQSCLKYADYAAVGDGEYLMLDILRGTIPSGIALSPAPFDDLDSLPFQHYGPNCYSLSNVQQHETKHTFCTSRGCFYACSYCQESILRRKPVRKSVRYVKDEIKYFLKLFPGTKIFTCSDSVFTYDNDWLEQFAKEFSEFKGLRFWVSTNAALLDDEILDMLKKANVDCIRIGVQSGSERIRKDIFDRKESLHQILEAAYKIHAMGLTGHYDFINENPYETPETLKETREFIRKLPISAIINKFEMRYWPGTKMTQMALDDGYIRPEDVSGQFMRFGNWTYTYQVIG
jgi:radical SAM superfamily enzyme YgiQ (UPF0313 family)